MKAKQKKNGKNMKEKRIKKTHKNKEKTKKLIRKKKKRKKRIWIGSCQNLYRHHGKMKRKKTKHNTPNPRGRQENIKSSIASGWQDMNILEAD